MNDTVIAQDSSILSPYFSLPSTEEHLGDSILPENEHLKKLIKKELFILSDINDKIFLINPTIKAFLEAFKEPKKLVDVIDLFAQKSQSKPSQIKNTMQTFYKEMQREGIIIPYSKVPDYINMLEEKSINEPCYNPGDKIGDYEIVQQISIKRASQVYQGKHSLSGQSVIIKTLIFPDIIPEKIKKRSRKKFTQEFRLMESLGNHPNICKFIELNETAVNPYAVIEHIEGESLRSYLSNNELSIQEKVNLIRDVITAIGYVQSKRLVHGDIHLSNFLVSTAKKIKLIDFGFSNNAEIKPGELKRNGAVYDFVPPERVKIEAFSFLLQRPDFRSEVFQLAVLSFYILYRQYPFSGFTWNELGHNIRTKEIELAKTSIEGDEIPERVLEMMNRSFQKNPLDRFADAMQMLEYLIQ